MVLLKTMYFKPYPTFDSIIRSFWYLVKLEFYLEINIADPDHPLQPAATYTSVAHIWDYVWSNMMRVREAHHWACAHPRLRELDVFAGSFRPYPPMESITWEQRQRQRFRAKARKGEERRGLAHVTCLEVEALRNGTEDGDLASAAHRAVYGPNNQPEPDYIRLGMILAASSPTPGD